MISILYKHKKTKSLIVRTIGIADDKTDFLTKHRYLFLGFFESNESYSFVHYTCPRHLRLTGRIVPGCNFAEAQLLFKLLEPDVVDDYYQYKIINPNIEDDAIFTIL